MGLKSARRYGGYEERTDAGQLLLRRLEAPRSNSPACLVRKLRTVVASDLKKVDQRQNVPRTRRTDERFSDPSYRRVLFRPVCTDKCSSDPSYRHALFRSRSYFPSGTSRRITPSRLFMMKTCPCGPTPKRRSARVAGGLPCWKFFSRMICSSVFGVPLSLRRIRRSAVDVAGACFGRLSALEIEDLAARIVPEQHQVLSCRIALSR